MTEQLSGPVAKRPVAAGSKSERDAVVMLTGGRELVLRRKDGNPFADPELDDLVGKRVTATGLVHGPTFVIDSWTEAGDDSADAP